MISRHRALPPAAARIMAAALKRYIVKWKEDGVFEVR
jgi:hypothetical protein